MGQVEYEVCVWYTLMEIFPRQYNAWRQKKEFLLRIR